MKIKSRKNFPNLLRKYRRERGLKQKDVARILGLKSTSRISKWENGSCIPSVKNVLKLSILYRVMVYALFIDLVRLLKNEIRESEEKNSEINSKEN